MNTTNTIEHPTETESAKVERLKKLTPPAKAKKLTELAEACNEGACNSYGIVRSLHGAIEELGIGELRDHPAYKCILGQLSFLANESAGPSRAAVEEFEIWKEINR